MSQKAVLTSSTSFAAVSADGADWRECVKKALDALEGVRTEGFQPNLGFLYVTEALSNDLPGIVSLIQSVTGIEIWTGSAAAGIFGNQQRYIDKPALSLMVTQAPPGSFKPLSLMPEEKQSGVDKAVQSWLDKTSPMLALLHGDPRHDSSPNFCIKELAKLSGGFVVGGLSSSRPDPVHIASDGIMSEGYSGMLFSDEMVVATCLSQGCTAITPALTITRCEGNIVQALDGRSPLEVFSSVLRDMVMDTTGKDPDKVMVDAALPSENIEEILNGDIHVAFPVQGTDMKDFLVRNMGGIDPDTGYLALTQTVEEGDTILFVKRNRATVRAELTRSLLDLRHRLIKQEGAFAPKGALYISCAARMDIEELSILREVMGDVPLTGFFAAGEIHGSRLYTYSGVLILFL